MRLSSYRWAPIKRLAGLDNKLTAAQEEPIHAQIAAAAGTSLSTTTRARSDAFKKLREEAVGEGSSSGGEASGSGSGGFSAGGAGQEASGGSGSTRNRPFYRDKSRGGRVRGGRGGGGRGGGGRG